MFSFLLSSIARTVEPAKIRSVGEPISPTAPECECLVAIPDGVQSSSLWPPSLSNEPSDVRDRRQRVKAKEENCSRKKRGKDLEADLSRRRERKKERRNRRKEHRASTTTTVDKKRTRGEKEE